MCLFIVFVTVFLLSLWSLLGNSFKSSVDRDSQLYKELIDLELGDKVENLYYGDDGWYFYNKRLCVGFQDCNPITTFCVKDIKQLAIAIKVALENGEHPDCPLIY